MLTSPLNATSKLLVDRAEKAACGERARSSIAAVVFVSCMSLEPFAFVFLTPFNSA